MKLSLDNQNSKLKILWRFDIYATILFAIISIIYLINISPGKMLLGWDNLPVELNPIVNIEKNWSSVWQEYQGLGVVAGNAHAVEFLRSLFVLPLTYLVPINYIRYLIQYIFIIVGVISTYVLFKRLNVNKHAAFLGAMFYFFNIGTMQNFYVPFEPFSAFYAFLPLSLLAIHSFLSTPKVTPKKVFYLSAIFLLTTFSFQVPTLFIVFSFILGFVILFRLFAIFAKRKTDNNEVRNNVSRIITICLIYLGVNLFWLLPFIYFLIGNIAIRSASLTTKLSTENVIYQGLAYANWADVALLRGFWYSNIDYLPDTKSGFGYMMQPWISWFDNIFVVIIGYGLSALALAGLIFSTLRKKVGIYIFVPILLISLFFFFGSNGVSGKLFDLLVKVVPPIGEAFRFAFTKWIVPLCLAFAFFFSEFFDFIIDWVKKYDPRNFILRTILVVASLTLIFYTAPYLTGNLYYKYNKFSLPSEYSEAIKYLSDDVPADKRIALLPVNSIWGWSFTNWDYRGSGFIWFGVPQAILSRTFDVWGLNNEKFYNEFQYALYSENPDLMKFVLNKYQIDYLLLDENVIMPNADRSLFYSQTKDLFSRVGSVNLDNKFNGKISLYKVTLDDQDKSYVYAPKTFENVNNSYMNTNVDSTYTSKSLNTINTETLPFNKEYLFSDDRQLADKLTNSNEITINNTDGKDKVLEVPSFSDDNDALVEAKLQSDGIHLSYNFGQIFDKNNNIIFSADEQTIYPLVINSDSQYGLLIGDKILDSQNSDVNTYISKNSSMTFFDNKVLWSEELGDRVYASELYDCAGGDGGKEADIYPGSIKIFSSDKPICVRFPPLISPGIQRVYKVLFKYKAVDGSSIRYCLRNLTTNKCENVAHPESTLLSGGYYQLTDYVYVNNTDLLKFELILETNDDKAKYYEASVRDISLETHQITGNVPVVDPAIYQKGVSEVAVKSADFPLKIVLPAMSSSKMDYIPGDKSYNSAARNCDQFNQKDFARTLNKSDNSFEYSATGAISCDNIQTDYVNPATSYLFTFDSKNVSGKAMDICISGHGLDKCLVQDRLKGKGKDSFILPSYPGAKNVGIYLENQSIGNLEAKNVLLGVSVKKIPYLWLKGLYLTTTASEGAMNPTTIGSVSKIFTYKYLVSVESSSEGMDKGLLILNQSYDSGWGIYNTDTCALGLLTPFTCQKAEAEHVLAKNWANGWVIPAGKAQYVLIFWPQYLQFIGYAVGGIGALGLIIWVVSARKRSI